MHGKNEKCIQNLVRKPEGKKPLEKSGHGWEDVDEIFIEIKEMCEGMDWINWFRIGTNGWLLWVQ
jgi:hypothetical protein